MIIHGDCLEKLRELPENSVDSVVTDPPYGLSAARNSGKNSRGGFMGKAWDYDVPSVEIWRECLRVLKPGGYLLAFAGTRTQHRMAVNIEDAGFEIRDMIMWVYGSGFPKSLDIGKAIDKSTGENRARQLKFTAWMRSTGITRAQIDAATNSNMGSHYLTDAQQPAIATVGMFDLIRPHLPGDIPEEIERLVAERTGIEWTAYKQREVVGKQTATELAVAPGQGKARPSIMLDITAPATPEAKQWDGWGTALKPAVEPITVARKPLIGTVAENVLTHGTGGINIDGCRVGSEILPKIKAGQSKIGTFERENMVTPERSGRFPANLIHDGSPEVLAGFPDSNGNDNVRKNNVGWGTNGIYGKGSAQDSYGYSDSGSAARFFYVPKADKRDRNEGCEDTSCFYKLKNDCPEEIKNKIKKIIDPKS